MDERKSDTFFGKGGAQLKIVVAVGPKNIDFLPMQTGQHQQPVQIVIFYQTVIEGAEGCK